MIKNHRGGGVTFECDGCKAVASAIGFRDCKWKAVGDKHYCSRCAKFGASSVITPAYKKRQDEQNKRARTLLMQCG